MEETYGETWYMRKYRKVILSKWLLESVGRGPALSGDTGYLTGPYGTKEIMPSPWQTNDIRTEYKRQVTVIIHSKYGLRQLWSEVWC